MKLNEIKLNGLIGKIPGPDFPPPEYSIEVRAVLALKLTMIDMALDDYFRKNIEDKNQSFKNTITTESVT